MSKLMRILFMFGFVFLGLLPLAQATESSVIEYTVKRGDWLSTIAKIHDTSWQQLARDNNIPNPNLIFPGQIISIKKPVEVRSRDEHKSTQTPKSALACEHTVVFAEVGLASWYGIPYHGRRTASGETYNMHDYTVAHPTLPLGTIVCISRDTNGKSVTAKVNDRGPFIRPRILDVSKRIAEYLDIVRPGTAEVRVSVIVAVKETSRHVRRRAHLRKAPDATQSPVTIDHRAVQHTALSPGTTSGNIEKDGNETATQHDRRMEIRAFLQEQIGPPYNTRPIEDAMIANEKNANTFATFLYRD